MTWWVIVNPNAGRRGAVEERTRLALRKAGVPHELRVSPSTVQVAEIVAEARNTGAHRFAAVGGDGSLHALVNVLMGLTWEEPPTLAALPTGSGSDFARTFALPRSIEGAVVHLTTEDVYPCDVGVIEGSSGRKFFLNVADAGVAAASVRVAKRIPRWVGGPRYSIAFWLALARFRPAAIELKVGKRTYAGKAINVVVANGQFFGGGMNIAPRASTLDGEFDIQVFRGPRREALTVMPRVIRGLHLSHRAVRRYTGSSFTLRCPTGWPVEADGELIGTGEITGRVLRQAIRFKI